MAEKAKCGSCERMHKNKEWQQGRKVLASRCRRCTGNRARIIQKNGPGAFWGRASCNFYSGNTRKYGFGGEGRGY